MSLGLTAPSLLLTRRLPMFSIPMFFTKSRTLSSYTRACTQQPQLERLHKNMPAGQAHASYQQKHTFPMPNKLEKTSITALKVAQPESAGQACMQGDKVFNREHALAGHAAAAAPSPAEHCRSEYAMLGKGRCHSGLLWGEGG